MWNKGAVVVIKHGDEQLANAIQNGVCSTMVPASDVNTLKRDYDLLKKRNTVYWSRKIRRAHRMYFEKPKKPLPNWTKPLIDIYALVVYGISMFVDKFMTIKDEVVDVACRKRRKV